MRVLYKLIIPFIVSSVGHSVGQLSPLNFPDKGSDVPTVIRSYGPNPVKAKEWVYLAGASYCDPASISSFTCDWCRRAANHGHRFYALFQNETVNTLAMITTNAATNSIVVTYRGTMDLRNFIIDLKITQDTIAPGVSVHSGFNLATMSLFPQVVGAIATLMRFNPTYNLGFTGHSLGGSMGAITAYFISNNINLPAGVAINPPYYCIVTFGQPRTGNLGFADYFNNNTRFEVTRVTNNKDIAPHYPPTWLFGDLSYIHFGTELWIHTLKPFGVTRLCAKNVYEDPTCSNSEGPYYNIIDHFPYSDSGTPACTFENPTDLAKLFAADLKLLYLALFLGSVSPFFAILPFTLALESLPHLIGLADIPSTIENIDVSCIIENIDASDVIENITRAIPIPEIPSIVEDTGIISTISNIPSLIQNFSSYIFENLPSFF